MLVEGSIMQVETLIFIAKMLFWVVFAVAANWPTTNTYTEVPVDIKAGDLVKGKRTNPNKPIVYGVVIQVEGRIIKVLVEDGRLLKGDSHNMEVVSCK